MGLHPDECGRHPIVCDHHCATGERWTHDIFDDSLVLIEKISEPSPRDLGVGRVSPFEADANRLVLLLFERGFKTIGLFLSPRTRHSIE